MKTYADKAQVEYLPRPEGDKCCGACVFLDTSGNALTCDRIAPPQNRVIPQGICKLFKSIIGEDNAE